MLIGNTENIDMKTAEYQIKINKIQDLGEKNKIVDEEPYKKFVKNDKKQVNEVILDNVSFGYNEETKDFFVRIEKNGIELKYPTESIMKFKQSLKAEIKNNLI